MEVGMKLYLVLPLALMLAACEKEGPLERAGEEVDEAVEDIQNGEETTANRIDDTIDEATENLDND
jgi:hypothetical protein